MSARASVSGDDRLDYEKLKAYQKAKNFQRLIRKLFFDKTDYDRIMSRQIYRSSLSVPLNIAEGVGRTRGKDRRHFYVVARGSLYETMACLEMYLDTHPLEPDRIEEIENSGREIARILNTLIRDLERFK